MYQLIQIFCCGVGIVFCGMCGAESAYSLWEVIQRRPDLKPLEKNVWTFLLTSSLGSALWMIDRLLQVVTTLD